MILFWTSTTKLLKFYSLFYRLLRCCIDFLLPTGSCTLCFDDGLFLTSQYGICRRCFVKFRQEQKSFLTRTCLHCFPDILKAYPLCFEKSHMCCKKDRQFLVHNLFEYTKTFKDVLSKFKFAGRFELKRCFAHLLYYDSFLQESLQMGFVLIPVPSTTEKEKGYNSVSLILNELRKMYGISSQNLLYTSATIPQKSLKKEERFENIRGKIFFRGSRDYDKVLLLDDVGTTGSTICEVLKTLFAHKVKEVRVLLLSIASHGEENLLSIKSLDNFGDFFGNSTER